LAADTLTADGVITSADGARIAYRAWPKVGAQITFAVAHGLGEHAGRYADFAEAMARRGFGTYAMDLRGHGRSSGQRGHVDSWSQWTDDIAAFVKRVEETSGQEVVPLGHSFGGVAMLSAVLQGKLPTARRFVVSSPALRAKVVVPRWKVNLAESTSKLIPRLAMSNQVDAGTLSRIPEVVAAYRTDPLVHAKISSRLFTEWQKASREVLNHSGQISIPFLIIAGTADNLIDSSGSEELHRVAKDRSELHLMPGGYHEPFNDADREDVFDLIAGWLAKR
jgi:alpha-beta hydrolase superfamily lysophospholipase